MTQDWFVKGIDDVAEAGRRACDGIQHAIEQLDRARQVRLAGAPLVETVEALMQAGAREARLQSTDVFHDYERAASSLRMQVVRSLVDEEGMSLTDVAQLTGISRQAAARLYRKDQATGPDPPRGPVAT